MPASFSFILQTASILQIEGYYGSKKKIILEFQNSSKFSLKIVDFILHEILNHIQIK
jgi:hypothetical protein